MYDDNNNHHHLAISIKNVPNRGNVDYCLDRAYSGHKTYFEFQKRIMIRNFEPLTISIKTKMKNKRTIFVNRKGRTLTQNEDGKLGHTKVLMGSPGQQTKTRDEERTELFHCQGHMS